MTRLLIYPTMQKLSKQRSSKKCAAFNSAFSKSSQPVCCPLYSGALVAEGACYEIQVAARGEGPEKWRRSLVNEAGLNRLDDPHWHLTCLQHQHDTILGDNTYTDEEQEFIRVLLIEALSKSGG